MARNLEFNWKEFIPKWDGNDKDKDPISVEIRSMKYVDVEAIKPILETVSNKDNTGTLKNVFLGNVRNCKNLSLDGKPLNDAQQFWDHAPFELTIEISNKIIEISNMGKSDEKN